MVLSQQQASNELQNINWLIFITENQCIYCAVRPDSETQLKAMLIFKVEKNKFYSPVEVKRLKMNMFKVNFIIFAGINKSYVISK